MTPHEKTEQNPKGAGPIPTLTDDVFKAVDGYLRTGVTIETACAAAGIKPGTYRSWIRRGREESERLEKTPRARVKKSEEIYLNFFNATLSTLAQIEARILGGIGESADGYDAEVTVEVYEQTEIIIQERLADGTLKEVERVKSDDLRLIERKTTRKRERDWRAGAWLLERRLAAQYSARAKVEHTGNVGVIGINVRPPVGTDEGNEE